MPICPLNKISGHKWLKLFLCKGVKMFPTAEEIGLFERLYFDVDLFPHQRYGQAFCNWFFYTDSEIFYEENTEKCRELVWSKSR